MPSFSSSEKSEENPEERTDGSWAMGLVRKEAECDFISSKEGRWTWLWFPLLTWYSRPHKNHLAPLFVPTIVWQKVVATPGAGLSLSTEHTEGILCPCICSEWFPRRHALVSFLHPLPTSKAVTTHAAQDAVTGHLSPQIAILPLSSHYI